MKQKLIKSICALALLGVGGCNVLFCAGCKSIEVERHAQKVQTYTDTNGVV